LLAFLRSFPDNFFLRYLCQDLLYQTFPNLATTAINANVTGFPGFSNYISSTGVQLRPHQFYPFVWRYDVFCIFTPHFTQYGPIFCQLFYIPAFLSVGNSYRAVADFHIVNAKIFAYLDIIIKLVTNKKCFKQGAAKI